MPRGGVVRWLIALGVFTFSRFAVEAALRAELVVDGLSRPVFVCSPPGDANRLFIVEQHLGTIRIFDRSSGALLPTPFFTDAAVRTGSEEGLLGLAFHPGYRTNGYFYINLMPRDNSPRRTEIRRYGVQGDPATSNRADPATRKLILSYPQPFANHNGGWMGFGPDGNLYISSGDGGDGDDPQNNGQSRTTLLGKILRIDVDGGDPYSIPDLNPFKGHATYREEIWAFGLRNPWRCSFDRATSNLWIGDVGQAAREEIDVIPALTGGLNFGWRVREGNIQNPDFPNETPVTTPVEPVYAYDRNRTTGGFSVTGGYVYRGNAVPELQGKYIFADYGTTNFWVTTLNGSGTNGTTVRLDRTANAGLIGRAGNVSSFGEDSQGELFICDLGGEIYQILGEGPAAARISAVTLEGAEIVIQFEAAANQGYTVEAKASLDSNATWASIEQVPAGAARSVTVTESVNERQRYFRIRSP